MQTSQWVIRSGLALTILGAAALMTASPASAQSQKPSTTTAQANTHSSMAPKRAGEDDAAEFTKLDKNKDGYLDKAEATMEPKVLGKWAEADTNKDGKISREEFLAFERKEHMAKR